jgi:hypothetical protein
VVTIREVL